jgi:hypothetical protein
MNQFEMSFIFNDVHIMNPTLSEDGRFSVSPAHYGFTIESTGGGSTAWVKRLDDGNVLVLTDEGGCSHNLDESLMMGLYDGDENEGTWGNCLGIIQGDEIK